MSHVFLYLLRSIWELCLCLCITFCAKFLDMHLFFLSSLLCIMFCAKFFECTVGYAEHAVLSLVTSKFKDCFSCFVFVLLFSIFLHKPCLERKLTAGNNVRRDFSCILYVIRISYLAFKYSLWSCVSRNLHWICIELF